MPDIDVLIAGGGLAGCAAAIAAARQGLRVVLAERGSYLGGNATRGMVAPWQSFHASKVTDSPDLPPQVIGGIAQEFVDDLVALGASLGHIVDPIGFAGSLTPVDADELKLYLPAKLAAAGVDVRLNTNISSGGSRPWLPTLTGNDEHVKVGRHGGLPPQDTEIDLSSARFVIDATGQSEAARLMGAPIELARELQPMSWLFTMVDVDTAAVRDFQLAHRDQFVLHPRIAELRADFVAVSGFFELVATARACGELDIPRDRLLFFSTPRPGEVLVNTTRIAADHPRPRLEGLRQVGQLAQWLPRRVPGFARARLGRLADDVGEREAARLHGRYVLSVDDLAGGREFPDAVARGCFPIDIHSASSDELVTRQLGGRGWYDIPLRCLQAPGIDRLLVCGRCISADAQGFASARTLPTAMATGHACGLLAGMYIKGEEFDCETCVNATARVRFPSQSRGGCWGDRDERQP